MLAMNNNACGRRLMRAALLVAQLVCAEKAWAQTPTSNASPVSATLPEDRGLVVDLLAQAQYDSNIFRTDNRLTPSVSDEIVIGEVLARYTRQVGNTKLRATADLGYDYYIGNSSRSRPRIDISGMGEKPLAGRCVLAPSARFLYRRSDFGDINAAVNNNQTVGTGRISLSCPRTAGFYPFAEGGFQLTRNGPLFRYADETAASGKIGAGYARPSLGVLTAYYEYLSSDRANLNFTNRIDRVGVTFHRAVARRIAFDFDLNYLNARSIGLNERPYRGLGWAAAITLKPSPSWSLRGASERVVINDSIIPAAFAIQSVYNLRLEYGGQARTRAYVGGQIGNRDFRDDPRVIASPFGRDHFREIYAGLERRVTKRLAMTAEARHFQRRTNTHVNEYNDTLGTVGVRLTY